MKIAVLFTGSYRTFDKTSSLIFKNLVQPNNAKCFFYCEGNISTEQFKEKIVNEWGKEYLGDAVFSITTRDDYFIKLSQFLLNSMPGISQEVFQRRGWDQSYLIRSGSILEHYQYQKCYDLMLDCEKKIGKFDIIIRSRLDLILFDELPLFSFFTSVDEESRKYCDNDEIYLRCLGNKRMMKHMKNKMVSGEIPTKEYPNLEKEIKYGDYVWTFCINWIWIGRRDVMKTFYHLVNNYGQFDTGKDNTFSSEIQFQEIMKHHNIKNLLYFSHEYDGPYAGGTKGFDGKDDDAMVCLVR